MNYKETTQPIWNFDEDKDEWQLFFNKEHKSDMTTFKPQTRMTKLIPGLLVMTPSGIGRYIKLDPFSDLALVKLSKSGNEVQYPNDQVSLYFKIYLKLESKEESQWYRLSLPANGDIILLKKEIETLSLTSTDNYSLLYNGNLVTDGEYFEKLDMRDNAKIYLFGCKLMEYKLSRVTQTIYSEWYTSDIDSIIFSCNRKIKFSGIGYFVACGGNTLTGKFKLYELGDTIIPTTSGRGGRRARREALRSRMSNEGIVEVDFELQSAGNETDSIRQIKLKRPIVLKPLCDYLITMSIINPCEVWYSNYDNSTFVGEKDVIFTFRHSDISDSSNVTEGNFPELYYFI
jgi:hypothetical protein